MPESEKQSRRDFLRGRAGDSKQAGDKDRDADSTERSAKDSNAATDCVQYFSHQAMACDFEVYFNDQQYSLAGDAAIECFQLIDQIEDQLSIYKSDSQISEFNRASVDQPVSVDASVVEVLRLGREISQKTDGAFALTSAALSDLWGFSRRSGQVPKDADIEQALKQVGDNHWSMNRDTGEISKIKESVALNLGGIGKGFAIDQCREVMTAHQIDHYLIHGGNSSVLARGNRNNERMENGWWVGIGHPVIPDQLIAEILLQDHALATSGTRRQGFVHQGQWYGHIIDPRNGNPSSHVISATVIAPTAAEADAYSTAFYVMGLQETAEYCRAHTDLAAVLVIPKPQSGFELQTFNLDERCLNRIS